MVFPQTPLDVHVEMKLPAWTQIQASPTGVRGADNIVITRGRADEQQSGLQAPSTCTMSLNNRDGRYSNRNPSSPYYGKIGRNTPIRVSTIGDGTTYTRLPGNYGVDNITTPDNAALHVTGDLDVRVDASLDNWLQYQTLAGRWKHGGTASSWIFYLGGGGDVRFARSLDGTDATNGTSMQLASLASSSFLKLAPGARQALRVTVATATGVVTFYTAPTIAGPWTALTTNNTIGPLTGNTFAGTEPLIIGESGQARTLNTSICAGKINSVQVLSGIGGSAVANPDFTAQSIGTTSFADAAGRTWTLNGDVEVTNRRYRYHGETSSFPQKWDTSGTDVWTPIECGGLLRRYQQGSALVASPIRRAVTTNNLIPIIYWSCEDASGASTFAVSGGSGQPMTITGSPTLATDTHIGGSGALPTIGSSTWTGNIPAYTAPSPDAGAVAFVLYLNSTPPNGAILARVICGSTRFDLGWSTGGSGGLFINAYDTGTGALAAPGNDFSGSPEQVISVGKAYEVQMWFVQTGSSINWGFGTSDGGGGNSNSANASLTSRTLGKMTQINVDPTANLTDTVVGHIAAYAVDASSGGSLPQGSSLTGNAGETAGSRFVRLCIESGVQPRTYGDPTASPAMGPQGVDTFINLLQSCVDADGGLMFEPRDVLALGIKMRSALMSQATAASLSYALSQLSAIPEPIDDDQLVRNTVTVTRTGGSYATATLVTGALSVNDPPNGVGQYPDTPTINYQSDSQLLDAASWRMHVGTVDESRWPVVTASMEFPEMVANPTLAQQVQALDIGQVLAITGMPSWLPPDDTRQLIQGVTETLSNFRFGLAFNCSPASPYDVVVLDDAVLARLDTDGSTLHDASISSSATSFQVDTTGAATGSPLWTADPSQTPFDVKMDGERITVSTVGSVLNANPFFDVSASSWSAQAGTIAWSTAQVYPHGGVGSLLITPDGVSASGGALAAMTAVGTVTATASYIATVWLYSPGGWSDLRACVDWYDSGGVFLSTTFGNAFAVAAGTWTNTSNQLTAPASASRAVLRIRHGGTPPGSAIYYAWSARLIPVSSYSASPQTFTVIRSVNGVSKSHTAGAAISLFRPFYLSP